MKTRPLVLSLCFALAIIGCSKKESEEPAAPPAPTAVVDPATTGSISGTVRLDGAPPVFRPIDMSAEAACVQANPSTVVPPIVVTGARGALAGVVVYVKSGLGSYRFDVPSAPVVLDQKGCMYVPRVLAIMTNQSFEVHNEDQTIHNVHPMPRENRGWNRSEPVGDPPIVATFTKPELAIPIACNIHPWMRAYLFVFAHPYFDITPKTGDFALKNLPPGTYTIEAWQEKFGAQDQTITIGPKESKSLDFVFHWAPPQ
ncbi:MAG: carboxypeptidase regulatory-like domain-containing protein [Candidatus Acidoferrales bacterium]|nr:carboxypeptidase regulatory-like domain-containing protein [Candidatus Acidoferrales bacterium]